MPGCKGFFLIVAVVAACGHPPRATAAGPVAEGGGEDFLQLVETAPIETSLDHPDLPEAWTVWKGMIDRARHSLSFAEFYASDEAGSRLEPIVRAIEEAAGRGVAVRFLAEKSFYATYPETLDRLRARRGIEVRLYDVKSLMGGVLHAKYFLVDGKEAWLGSQNFDWRSLTHIQELGVRIRQAEVLRSLREVFETDWDLAGRATPPAAGRREGDDPALPADSALPAGSRGRAIADSLHQIRARDAKPVFPVTITSGGDTVRVTPVFSPRGWLPDRSLWDLPRLVDLISSARSTVRVQLLTYGTLQHGRFFAPLEDALRAAAARGVSVELLLSNGCERPGLIEGLQSLEVLPGIEVRLETIPPWSGGFVPYARVIHAKLLVVDDEKAWIGTGNWEWDYFHASRNVGLILEGRGTVAALSRFFLDGWDGPYAEPVRPCAAYAPPRIGG